MSQRKDDRGKRIAYAIKITKAGKLSALALEIGVNESAICRWKQSGNITFDNACTLCEILDVSMDWLALGRGSCFQHRREADSDCRFVLPALSRLSDDSANRLSDFIKSVLAEVNS